MPSMRPTSVLTILLSFFLFTLSSCSEDSTDIGSTLDSALSRLDSELSRSSQYIDKRQNALDSIKSLLSRTTSPTERARLSRQLADKYYDFQIDSAISYYNRGIHEAYTAGDSVAAQAMQLRRLSLMPLTGALKECFQEFEAIDPSTIMKENVIEYYESGSRLYFFTKDYIKDDSLRHVYGSKGMEMAMKLVDLTEPETPAHTYYAELKRFFTDGNKSVAVANLTDQLDKMNPEDQYYSRIAVTLMYYYNSVDNDDRALYYLTTAAISDILSGTREEVSLLTLGEEMYKRGDIERSYQYLNTSLQNAVESGARSRALQAAQYAPIIEQSIIARDENRLKMTAILASIIAIALIIIILIAIRLHRRSQRLKILKEQLSEANKTKESYISEFLILVNVHMQKQEEIRRVAVRKLKAGQGEELLSQLNSGKLRNEALKAFNDIFDKAFLHIYPNFIDSVTNLLQPSKRNLIPQNGQLNTELRILAFMRLNIDDSNSMARFLGVSINTIYTYRNKMKAAAINRDTFEEDILHIDQL